MKNSIKIICIVCFTLSLIGCQSDIEKKESFFQKATEYFEKKEYTEAEIELKNCLQLDPNYIPAYHLLAKNMLKLGNIKGAFSVYNKILQIDNQNIEANLKIAGFLVLGKKTEQAMEKIVFVLEKDPKNIDALLIKAQIFMQKKSFDKALIVYNSVLDIDSKNIPAMQNTARIYAFTNKIPQAEELLLKTITIDPKNLKNRLILIGFYIKQNNIEKVEYQLNQSIQDDPDSFDPYILLGNFYYNQQKLDLAEKNYQNAIDKASGNLKPYLVAAGFYDKIKEKEKALKMYRDALSLEPDNISVKNTIAQFHYSHKDIDSSKAMIEQILSQRSKFYPTRLLKSEILISEKKYSDALNILTDLEKEEPNSARLYYFKGLAYIGTGNYNQAKISVAKAVELSPSYFKTRTLLSDLYLREQSYDLSEKEATKALKLIPNDYRTRLIRANAYVGLNKMEQAEKDLLTLTQTSPDNPMAFYQLGMLSFSQKKIDVAEDYFDKAYAKNNKLIDTFLQKINIHVIKKEYKEALDLCNKQLDIYKDIKTLQAIVHNLRAGVFLVQKEGTLAQDALNTAISLDPDYIKSYETLAKIFLSENKKDDAIKQYEKIIEIKPETASAHMILGTIYDASKDYEKAAYYYKKALEINPNYAAAANNLAYHYLKRTDNIDEAFNLARIAKTARPEDPSIMDTMGMAYYGKELYGNAIHEFLDSLKKIPDHPVVNYHLGLAYHKNGDKQKALDALKKAMSLSDKFDEVDNARQIITELEK
ncbi:MAG: tetratricopeptide repeat protein [Pseudomonadota bacterium]